MNNISSYDEVVQLVDSFCEEMKAFEVEYSFAHVVLDDLNLDNHTIIRCQTNTESILNWINDETGGEPLKVSEYTRAADKILRFLSSLLEISEEIRDPKEECKWCGTPIAAGFDLCNHCGFIDDLDKILR